jgi:hypothetical protein
MGQNAGMQTVGETRHFVARAGKLLSKNGRNELIDFVATRPLRGDLLAGTGGMRKVRFARGARGKSGGVRVIYYYYSTEKPIFLLEIFGKNEWASLTAKERNRLAKIVAEIKRQFQRTTK